jgi:hypothetical protein
LNSATNKSFASNSTAPALFFPEETVISMFKLRDVAETDCHLVLGDRLAVMVGPSLFRYD